MCRGQPHCTELGPRERWSALCPLPVPSRFRDAVRELGEAVAAGAQGDRSRALTILARLPSNEAREWGREHGQVAGLKRCQGMRKRGAAARSRRLVSRNLRARVHERDGYRCRYCGMEVIDREAIKEFARFINGPEFSFGSTIESRHGIALLATAQMDHLIPHSVGGDESDENMITACWTCQFGKDGYTLEQLGIQDPRGREPVLDSWDGLTACIKPLRATASRAAV